MQPLTNVFEPVNTSNYILASICSVIAVISIIALIIYNRKATTPDKNTAQEYKPNRFKPLLSLGLFFIFLICASTAFFSWLTTKKITTVTINDEFIETPYGKTTWDNIQKIYIHEDQTVAPFSGRKVGEVTKILTIVEIDGKTHALSEVNYDLNEIGKAINAVQKK